MKRKVVMMMTCMAVLGFLAHGAVMAQDITPQQVVDHVDKAVQLIVDQGEEKAFPALTDPNGEWVNGELYVFIYDLDGNIVAHLNKKLEGKNLMKIKDVKGNVFAAEFVAIAKSDKGEGWTEYWWPKPNEKKASPKSSFIKRVPGKDLLVGVGIYDMDLEDAKKATGR